MVTRKYKNIRVIYDGKQFDSKKEARRYGELQLLEYAEEISNLEIHPRYTLQASFWDPRGGRNYRSITYTGDFFYRERGTSIVEDVKSRITRKEPAYNIKKKLFIKKYPDIEFREVI